MFNNAEINMIQDPNNNGFRMYIDVEDNYLSSPEVWDEYRMSEHQTLYVGEDNGLFTFMVHNKMNTNGVYGTIIKTRDGRAFKVSGCWSSRTGVVNMATGLDLVGVVINGCSRYISRVAAEELAGQVGYTVVESTKYNFPYTCGPVALKYAGRDNELSFTFIKKEADNG